MAPLLHVECWSALAGKVYFFPSDAERVCCVDPETDEVKLIGPIFLEGMNKWQQPDSKRRASHVPRNGFSARDGVACSVRPSFES